MSHMSFIDEMKDKAGRLIPTAYSDIVEETTSDMLLVPDRDKVLFICDSANLKEDNAVDVIRAVRRRIEHKSPKVQCFTVGLLEALVKQCGTLVHLEIADTKGLLRDLVAIAAKAVSRDGEREAKKAALALILNMSIWFSAGAAANEKLRPLTLLADDVRKQCGEAVFAGIDVDTTVQLRRNVAPQQKQQQQQQQQQQRSQDAFNRAQQREYLRLQQLHQHQQLHPSGAPRVVAAIPVLIPSDAEVSAMLDSCLLLAECLNAAEGSGVSVIGDDVIAGIAAEIRRQHRLITMYVASGAELPNMEILLSVVDSQSAVIERLADTISIQGRQLSEVVPSGETQHQQQQQQQRPAAPASDLYGASAYPGGPSSPPQGSRRDDRQQQQFQAAVNEATRTTLAASGEGRVTSTSRSRQDIRSAADVDDGALEEMEEMRATDPMPTAAVPTMDDIFSGVSTTGSSSAAATSSSRPQQAQAAFPAPSQSLDHGTRPSRELTHSEGPVPNATRSLNADNDDFDSFLNDRLAKHC